MKKIFALLICTIMMICALPIAIFAEGDSVSVVDTNAEVVITLPVAKENAAESDFSGDREIPKTSTEKIVEYIKTHFEEISVVIGIILSSFYQARKHKVLNKSVGTLNNNAVEVSRNSDATIQKALADMKDMADSVAAYKQEFADMLTEVRESAEEKRKIEEALDETLSFIKAAKLANVELGNEVAELLCLSNIPNSKKDELYSRHLAAVGAIADAEVTEVISHDHGK